jgi:hypothetical protein
LSEKESRKEKIALAATSVNMSQPESDAMLAIIQQG